MPCKSRSSDPSCCGIETNQIRATKNGLNEKRYFRFLIYIVLKQSRNKFILRILIRDMFIF